MLTTNHRSKSVRIVIALVLLVLTCAGKPAQAATSTLFVRWNATTGANNGTSWANAYTSLQSALSVASTGTEIWVAAGTYRPTTGSDRTVSFSMKNGVKIYGTETQLPQ